MRICNLCMVLCPWFIGFYLQVMELIYLCNILKTILYPFMDRELYSLSSAFHAIVSHRNSESKLGSCSYPNVTVHKIEAQRGLCEGNMSCGERPETQIFHF